MCVCGSCTSVCVYVHLTRALQCDTPPPLPHSFRGMPVAHGGTPHADHTLRGQRPVLALWTQAVAANPLLCLTIRFDRLPYPPPRSLPLHFGVFLKLDLINWDQPQARLPGATIKPQCAHHRLWHADPLRVDRTRRRGSNASRWCILSCGVFGGTFPFEGIVWVLAGDWGRHVRLMPVDAFHDCVAGADSRLRGAFHHHHTGGGGDLVPEETCLEKFSTPNSGAIFPITFNDCGGIFPAQNFSGQKFSRTKTPPPPPLVACAGSGPSLSFWSSVSRLGSHSADCRALWHVRTRTGMF